MDTDQSDWLKERGWHTWYSEEYWVNPKTIANPEIQDYTNYGMTMADAVRYENDGAPVFKPVFGLPVLNMMQTIHDLQKKKGDRYERDS